MPHTEPLPPKTDAQHSRPVRTAGLVIYLTLALLMVAIPQSLVNWFSDMNDNAVVVTLLRGATALQNFAIATGIAIPYRRAREFFLAESGAGDQ
jgi:hypothetical protein